MCPRILKPAEAPGAVSLWFFSTMERNPVERKSNRKKVEIAVRPGRNEVYLLERKSFARRKVPYRVPPIQILYFGQ